MPSRLRALVLDRDDFRTPKQSVVVEAFNVATGVASGEDTSDVNGEVTITGLADATYVLRRKSGASDVVIVPVTETWVSDALHGNRATPSAHSFSQISSRTHGKDDHQSPILQGGANEDFGPYYVDVTEIAVPANPGANVRRLFVNTATGELSVRTSAGSTVSLEGGGGYSDADAISAVEGEATLDLAGDVKIANAKGLVVGHTSKITGINTPELQVLGTGAHDSKALLARFSANASSPVFQFLKGRGNTIGDTTIVVDGDSIGGTWFLVADGNDLSTLVAVYEVVVDDASPAQDDIGVAHIWASMPGGVGAGGRRNAMRLDAAGNLHVLSSHYLTERAAAGGDTAGDGQVWVKDDAPNTLYFTDDDGVDHPISKASVRFITIRLVPADTSVAVGAIANDWVCPFTGTLLQDDDHKELLMAYNDVAGSGGGPMVVDIHLQHEGGGEATIMTANKLDIETTEKNTRDATTQPDLTTTAITKGDIFTFEIDAIHSGTAALGLSVAFAIRET